MTSEEDAKFMAEAIRVAQQARLHSSPNPWVGAIVVAQGQVVGEGATGSFQTSEETNESPTVLERDKDLKPVGGVHAEIKALEEAGELAKGATLYTTLEPCNHQGLTGPCTNAIINSGIRRVVVALTDPDKRVSGSGLEALRSAGIAVDTGQNSDVAAQQLNPYLHHRVTGRPYVVKRCPQT